MLFSMVEEVVVIAEQIDQEQRDIIAWRFVCLTDAGADTHHAQLVSERLDISLHSALDLLEKGCTPALMAAILL